jgi:N-acetylneuraminic acid mutarotase
MFGGDSALENEMWWYNPAANTWTQQIMSDSPSARARHSMVWDGSRVIMFGGHDGVKKRDLWWWE